jgi:uncharacterized protein DUF11
MPRSLRRVIWLGIAAVWLVLIGGAGVSGAQGSEECAASGPRVCVSASATPQTVSPSRTDSPTYISYGVDVTNRSRNNVAHTTLTASFPSGSSLVSTDSEVGSCSANSAGLVCNLGSLASGSAAQIDVVVTAPLTEGTAVATFAVSFDEGPNDNGSSDPKQDTISTMEAVTVAATSGSASSFVPEGGSVELSTDPTGAGVATPGDALLADAMITSAPTALTASIEEVAGTVKCPKGVVCRQGDWVHATIPGTFDPPLSFSLRWDKSLIPRALSGKKFVLLLTECLNGCPVQIVSSRCPSATPAQSALPCLWNVAAELDGDWVATLFNKHNGYMH